MNGKRACSGLECRTKFVSLRCLSEPRTQRRGVSGRVPWGTAYSAALRARLGQGALGRGNAREEGEGTGGAVAGNRYGMLASTVPGLQYRRLRGKSLNAGALPCIG